MSLRLLIPVALAGCSAARAPEPAPPELPQTYAEEAGSGGAEPRAWWRVFEDPALDAVVERALEQNFDLAESVARVQQARVRARLADAAILPVVRARAAGDTFDTPVNAGIGAQFRDLGLEDTLGAAGFTLPERLGLTTYSLAADVSWEIDLWGRLAHSSRAAGAQLMASESDLRAARIGVLSETIAAYFDVVDLRRRIALARETSGVLREREELAELRYARGLAASLSLQRVRQDSRATEAGVPQLESRLAAAESRLAILLGGHRRDLAAILPDELRPAPAGAPVPAGVPADLLRQRPDVQAAWSRLEAAGHEVEARRAALLPRLSLAGTIGLQAVEAGDLFDVKQWFGNLMGNLLHPVFDAGRLKGEQALAEARFDELAAGFGRTVVTAVNEVEAALAALRHERRRYELLAARRGDAESTMETRAERYASGLGGYADYLDASRTVLDVESALAGAERNLNLARLRVHRALGGAWTGDEALEGADLP